MDNKDLLNKLRGLEDQELEKIAEEFPPLNDADKARIISKCLEKTNDTDNPEGVTVSGTEKYKRPVWYKFAATAAALTLAVLGLGGTVYLTKNMKDPSASDMANQSTSARGAGAGTYTISEQVKENAVTTVVTSTSLVTTTTTCTSSSVSTTDSTSTTNDTTTSTTDTTTETSTATADPMNTETTAVTEPSTETHTETTTVKLPVGYWSSEYEGKERHWLFYHDGSGGKFHNAETGMGLAFTIDTYDETVIFHIGSSEDSSKARITWYNADSFAIDWEENDIHEVFTFDPDEKIEN